MKASEALSFSYRVRRSKKAKRVSISVSEEGIVTAVLPRGVSEAFVHGFVRTRVDWIERTIEAQKTRLRKRRRVSFAFGEAISVLGVSLMIAPGNPGKRTRCVRKDSLLLVDGVSDGSPKDIVVEWLKGEARAFFGREVHACAEGMNVPFGRISIRDQKTRWGSCSRAGNLNFSWRLVLTPVAVARYVVIHECAHLVHLNHSKAFWSLVAHHCPEYKECVRWLKEHGMSLR